jgi:hypothetical protein
MTNAGPGRRTTWAFDRTNALVDACAGGGKAKALAPNEPASAAPSRTERDERIENIGDGVCCGIW